MRRIGINVSIVFCGVLLVVSSPLLAAFAYEFYLDIRGINDEFPILMIPPIAAVMAVCVLIATVFLSSYYWTRSRRIVPGVCPKCRYDLSGNLEINICPECGSSVAGAIYMANHLK